MKAIITGITGQDGSYLAELLLEKEYDVYGIVRRCSVDNLYRIRHFVNRLHISYGDIIDRSFMTNIIADVQPDEFYNLAAQSEVGLSYISPEYTAEVNGFAVVNILNAIHRFSPSTRFYQASTSELYGNPMSSPQTEDTPFKPISPYSIAKLYAYWVTIDFRESYGLFTVNGILFNHESPRRGSGFVTQKIIQHVKSHYKEGGTVLKLGNLDSKRDWGYSPDYVKAMWMMLQHDMPGEYVVATKEQHSVKEFCELAFRHIGVNIVWKGSGRNCVGISKENNLKLVEVDPALFRPRDINNLLGDYSKINKLLGWSPSISFTQLVDIMASDAAEKS